ncbi:MAG: permease [Candidatus Eremiobacteraeota bacterium]|nr:permease [Candidatus Eremiobacteraeota bacterium]
MRRVRDLVSGRALRAAALRPRAGLGRRLILVTLAHALVAGISAAAGFFWDSLFGLIFGFLVSAIAQVMLTPATIHRYLGPGLRGLLYGTGFGIISSACSYGAAAAARGFYRNGADARAVFAFLISSTNMNVAIVILFWSLLGWRFAFAEFFGGVIIIGVVTTGLSLLFRSEGLAQMQRSYVAHSTTMEGHCEHHGASEQRGNRWAEVASTALADVRMLRTELIVGYLIAGFAAALIPPGWLAGALHAVGSVPAIGYVLLLVVGLLIAVATFVCSMGNVPVARYLANAGIPLGANTTFIYGDLLIPPLLAIYRKSFPPRVTWAFVTLFTAGALLAGAIMERVVGGAIGPMTMGSMAINDRFTLVSNVAAIVAVACVALAARRGAFTTA